MSWTCSKCDSEWDNVWQFFYVNKNKLCLACETELTDEVREKGEFKKVKQQEKEDLLCPCNNKIYSTLAKLKTHQKTKGHLKWLETK